MKWILFEMCSKIEIKFWICEVKDIIVFLEMAFMPGILKVIWLGKKLFVSLGKTHEYACKF